MMSDHDGYSGPARVHYYDDLSTISFTPDHSHAYVVAFTDKEGKSWTEPVVGWAVVVVGFDDEINDGGIVKQGTRIEPVVLDTRDGHNHPSTMGEYQDNSRGWIFWKLRQGGGGL